MGEMQMKKIIAILLVTLLGVGCFAACSNKDTSDGDTSDTVVESVSNTEDAEDESKDTDDNSDDKEKEKVKPKTYAITSATEGVRVFGVRNLASDNSLNLTWSCSGVEFAVRLDSGSVKFNFVLSKPCLFRVWVDGEEYKQGDSPLVEVSTLGIMNLSGLSAGEHTIKLLKVTDPTRCPNAELKSVIFAGELITDREVKDKELYIEFIGDSITSGYGTLNIDYPNDGTYTAMDGTLAYAYLLAKALDADYSMTSLSGYRLVEHFIKDNEGEIADSLYLKTAPTANAEEDYGFERKADIVVINLGTNDYSLNKGEQTFEEYYVKLLNAVKEKNGEDCKILCLYNVMNDGHYDQVLSACEELSRTYDDVYTLKLNRTARVHTGHPTAEENIAYAEVIMQYLNNTVFAETEA
jgi:hypothetical protein